MGVRTARPGPPSERYRLGSRACSTGRRPPEEDLAPTYGVASLEAPPGNLDQPDWSNEGHIHLCDLTWLFWTKRCETIAWKEVGYAEEEV